MKNLEKDRLENKINGYLAIVAGLVMMFEVDPEIWTGA